MTQKPALKIVDTMPANDLPPAPLDRNYHSMRMSAIVDSFATQMDKLNSPFAPTESGPAGDCLILPFDEHITEWARNIRGVGKSYVVPETIILFARRDPAARKDKVIGPPAKTFIVNALFLRLGEMDRLISPITPYTSKASRLVRKAMAHSHVGHDCNRWTEVRPAPLPAGIVAHETLELEGCKPLRIYRATTPTPRVTF